MRAWLDTKLTKRPSAEILSCMSLWPLPAIGDLRAIGLQADTRGGAGLQIAHEHVLRAIGVVGNEIPRERGEDDVAAARGEFEAVDAVGRLRIACRPASR